MRSNHSRRNRSNACASRHLKTRNRAVKPVIEAMETRRLLANLGLDTSFGGGDGFVTASFGTTGDSGRAMVVLDSGKILVAGVAGAGPLADWAIARFNANGTIDMTFGGGDGKVTTDIAGGRDIAVSIAALSGGRFLIAGTSDNGGTTDVALARYNADGTLDKTFGGGDGKVTTDLAGGDDRAADVVVLNDGRIVLAGTATRNQTTDLALIRYKADGSIDTAFGGGTGKVFTGTDGNDHLRSHRHRHRREQVGRGRQRLDVDMFKFSAAAGQSIGIDIDLPHNSKLLPYLRIFDSAGSELATAYTTAAPGEVEGREAYIRLNVNTAGTYYVGVSSVDNNDYDAIAGVDYRIGGTCKFVLVVSDIPTPPDPNDQISEALKINVGSTTAGVITPATDVNLYKFQASAGLELRFDVDRPAGSYLRPYLRLFDGSGVERRHAQQRGSVSLVRLRQRG